MKTDTLWRWGLLSLASAIFFCTTGATFSSLIILLPSMIEDLGWNWTGAGAGFTLLALMTGLSSTLPATTLKLVGERNGLRIVYLSGGVFIVAGFATIAATDSLLQYWIGASLVGIGYSQTGAVPAVHLASGWFGDNRARAIGFFFTAGALGSVAAPLVSSAFLTATGAWRPYWWLVAALVGLLATIASLTMRSAATIVEKDTEAELETLKERRSAQEVTAGEETVSHPSEIDWTLSEVFRSPQYYVIVMGLTFTLLGAVTMNTVAGGHLENLGVDQSIIAWAISGHAMFNAMARAFGGIVASYIDAKWLFFSGLASGVIGMLALSQADNLFLIVLFAVGDGYCFGMVVFASTILLLNYFGARHNPAILGTMNLISTVAMIGPVLAGRIGDMTGGFTPVFLVLGALMALPCVAVILMPRPIYRHRGQAGPAGD